MQTKTLPLVLALIALPTFAGCNEPDYQAQFEEQRRRSLEESQRRERELREMEEALRDTEAVEAAPDPAATEPAEVASIGWRAMKSRGNGPVELATPVEVSEDGLATYLDEVTTRFKTGRLRQGFRAAVSQIDGETLTDDDKTRERLQILNEGLQVAVKDPDLALDWINDIFEVLTDEGSVTFVEKDPEFARIMRVPSPKIPETKVGTPGAKYVELLLSGRGVAVASVTSHPILLKEQAVTINQGLPAGDRLLGEEMTVYGSIENTFAARSSDMVFFVKPELVVTERSQKRIGDDKVELTLRIKAVSVTEQARAAFAKKHPALPIGETTFKTINVQTMKLVGAGITELQPDPEDPFSFIATATYPEFQTSSPSLEVELAAFERVEQEDFSSERGRFDFGSGVSIRKTQVSNQRMTLRFSAINKASR